MHPAHADPYVLTLAFACFWLGGAAVMSRIAGWHVLGSRFPAPSRLQGKQLRFCTASVGSASFAITYRRCVRVVLSEQGLGLRLMRPFSFYSPPFLAPWSSVASCTESPSFGTVKVTFAFHGTDRRVTFAGPLGQAVKARYQAATASAT
jgi:hypothetical protein